MSKLQSQKKDRQHIPVSIKRSLLIECGYKCSVPQCSTQWPTLQQHHIDGNPANNEIGNILMLCPNHHQMVTSGHIDRASCEILKELLNTFNQLEQSPKAQIRNQLLFSLIAELCANLILLFDRSFYNFTGNQIYPRLRHTVLDQALAAGVLIQEQNRELFTLLYDWATSLDDFNRRLDITEFRDLPRMTSEEIPDLRKSIVSSEGFQGPYALCARLTEYLLDNYTLEIGIDRQTLMFGTTLETLLTNVKKSVT